MAHKLFVCLTCLAEGEDAPKGPALLADLQARFADAPDLEVVGQDCLSACATPQAIAVLSGGADACLTGHGNVTCCSTRKRVPPTDSGL